MKNSKKTRTKRHVAKTYFKVLNDIGTPTLVIENKRGQIYQCNSSFEELSGLPEPKIMGEDIFTFFNQKEHSRVSSFLDILKNQSGELSEVNLSFRKKSGRKVSINLQGKTVELSGSRRFTVLTFHNLEQIRKLQIEKEEAIKEMSHISKLADIGRLAAGVAHELNNPLMIIQGFAENIE